MAIPIRLVPNRNITAGSEKDDTCIIRGIAKAVPVIKKIAKNKNKKILNFIFGLLPFDLIVELHVPR